MIIVEPGDPGAPEPRALLEASHALMQSLFPAEDNFFLSIDDLRGDDIRFFTARTGTEVQGTVALALKGDYGEVKSLYVAETARGQGLADALMRQIEDTARAEGLPWLRLETGNTLHAAHALYRRIGFTTRGPFGDYPDAETSVFMEKWLD